MGHLLSPSQVHSWGPGLDAEQPAHNWLSHGMLALQAVAKSDVPQLQHLHELLEDLAFAEILKPSVPNKFVFEFHLPMNILHVLQNTPKAEYCRTWFAHSQDW